MSAPKPLPKPEEVLLDDGSAAVEGFAAYEVPADDASSGVSDGQPAGDASAGVALPASWNGYPGDSLQYLSMQSTLLLFVLVALLLNLGANLWLAFSDKWRS